MRKVTRNLDFVNREKGTIFHREVTGYLFTAKTSDGIDIAMYVYQDKQGGEQAWQVNDDMGSNSLVTSRKYDRRKDAIEGVTALIGRVKEERFIQLNTEAKRIKAGLTKIDDPLGGDE